MSSSDAAKATADGFDIAEDSETMVEIKIKTLDSQTYTLRVNKCVPVPALKEQIATVTGVLSEQQRLICRGKVLKDDQLLSAYHVEDGHTLHLVVRQPLQSASTSYMESEGPSEASSVPGNTHNRGSPVAHSFVFESVNVDQGDTDNSIISRILSSMLDSIGATSSRTGPTTTAVREPERLARISGDNGPSDSNRPRPNPANPQSSSSRRPTGSAFPSSVPSVLQNPPVIPDSLTTLNQYIGLMEDEFRREGFGSNVSEQIDHTEATGLHLNEGRSRESHFHAPLSGLPSPASLAEILLSTRHLLMEQTGECLSLLARQLEGHTSIMDPQSRMNLQSSAIRSGILMRDLGSLLLELGRTTMTLRMGQIPAEAVVNAGPANFISANGPNPLMVQPVPFYPGPNVAGVHMGSANSGHGQGEQPDPVLIPTRNIEIRIRTAGRAVPVATPGANAAAAGQQQQEQTDSARNLSGPSVVHRAFPSGESGIRVVPLRTVVAVPSGVNPSTPDSLANSVRMFYPLIARVRPQTTGNASDSRGFEASSQLPQGVSEFEWLSLNQSARQRENLESNSGGALRNSSRIPVNIRPFGSGLNPPANESAAHQGDSHVSFSSRQSPPNNNSNGSNLAFDDTTGGSESHDTANAGEEQGVFFANVLHQIMPLITQGREQGASTTDPSSSAAEIERENLDGSSSSRRHRDPPESPRAKRMKKND